MQDRVCADHTIRHHSGVVRSESTVEMAVHLLAKVESAPYFSARMAVVPPMGIPDRITEMQLPEKWYERTA